MDADRREARRKKLVWGRLQRDLRKTVTIGAVLAALLSGGLQAAVIKATGLDDAKQFLDIVAVTAPLTVAVTLAVLLWTAVPEDRLQYPYRIFWTFLLFIGAALITGAVGGNDVVEYMDPSAAKATGYKLLMAILAGFFRMYGRYAFWISLITGCILAYAAMRVLRALEEAARKPTATPDAP